MTSKGSIWFTRYLFDQEGGKKIEKHRAQIIVSWPNPKQWEIVHISDLMTTIRKSIYPINHHKGGEMCKLKAHSPIYYIMDNWENMLIYITYAQGLLIPCFDASSIHCKFMFSFTQYFRCVLGSHGLAIIWYSRINEVSMKYLYERYRYESKTKQDKPQTVYTLIWLLFKQNITWPKLAINV